MRPTMPLLRNPPCLARLLLACFALSLAVAMAAPWVQAQPLERLCSASGDTRWVPVGGNDAGALPDEGHPLQCTLCLPPMLPGAHRAALPAPQGRPVMAAAARVRMGHVPALSRAAFPPRAPPASTTAVHHL
jgi:hypothetical protein